MKRRVWDLPVRIFHWLLVACIATLWISRGATDADLHAAAGYSVIALLAFRVLWGFIGSAPARFASFLYSPGAALRYLGTLARSSSPSHVSHNPAGSWSIYVLLALVALCAVTGLVIFGGEKQAGPLAGYVSPAVADAAHVVHEYAAWVMLGVAFLHLVGVIASSILHRENYAAAMVHGAKQHVPPDFAPIPPHGRAGAVLAAIVLGTFAGPLAMSGWLEGYRTLRSEAKTAKAAVTIWQKECGSCHVAYPPNLLPARSWEKMLVEQETHFGEDLSLNDKTLQTLREFAEKRLPATDWTGMSLAAGIAPSAAPLRITETAFWLREHERLDGAQFSKEKNTGKHQCEGCHHDVDSGMFRFRMIHIP